LVAENWEIGGKHETFGLSSENSLSIVVGKEFFHLFRCERVLRSFVLLVQQGKKPHQRLKKRNRNLSLFLSLAATAVLTNVQAKLTHTTRLCKKNNNGLRVESCDREGNVTDIWSSLQWPSTTISFLTQFFATHVFGLLGQDKTSIGLGQMALH